MAKKKAAKKTAAPAAAPAKKTFAQMKVGETFVALGERLVKSSELTYRSLDNPTMGEYPAGPILDKQIGVEPSYIKTKTTVTKDPEVQATEDAVSGSTSTPINVRKAFRMPPPLGIPKKGVTVTRDADVQYVDDPGNIHIPINVKKARPVAR